MAYQTQNITTLAAIVAHVATFAALQGWTVSGGNTFTHPSLGGAISAILSSPSATQLRFTPQEAGAPYAEIRSPTLNSGEQSPTKLHMFIAQTPQPYIALVVEYGFNSYRHLYFGYAEKVGTYNGGEVVAASNHQRESNSNGKTRYDGMDHQYLCRGHQQRFLTGQAGGVRVSHLNNATLWRQFDEDVDNLNLASEYLDTTAFGGYGDGVNDGYVMHGQSPFLGANILIPIDLVAPRFPGANPHMSPLGRPAGVRMVNMRDLEPGAQIVVGAQNWRVFSAHSKQSFDTPVYGVGNYPITETSYYVGYAYPET
jgi:hypothetical protein